MKSRLAALSILILACSASAFKIHVQNPWPNTPMWTTLRVISSVIAGPPGAAMTDDGGGWYSITLADNLAANATFIIVMYPPASYDPTQPDYAGQLDFGAGGISKTGPEFSIGAIKNIAPDVWIIPQGGTNPPVITDIPVAKKVAILFNPWPDNAPTAEIGSATTYGNMYMSPDPKRCGWYGAYFMGPPFTVAFKSLFGTESYGIGGLGDAKAIDLSAYFATSDTLFLVPDPVPGGPPKILTSIPVGVVGTCSFPLAVTVRDFSIQHPDFEKADMASDVANLGLVTNTLGADGKPVRSTKPYNRMSDFADWFKDDSTAPAPFTNYTTCRDLPMSKSNAGLWGYDSFKSEASHSYFPIDDFNRFNETAASQYIDPVDGTVKNDPTGAKHNFSFCMEMHATFKYKQGQEFNFVGDDDVWAFIDKKLVMDLGGPHPPLPGKVRLDTLKLTPGQDYPFDFFFCERHTTGSDLTIQTSIFFEQQQSVFTKVTDLPGGVEQYDIYERTSGSHNCEASTTDQVAPAKSEFKLSGPSVNPPAVLPIGPSYGGGVTVNPGQTQVTVDAAHVTGLRPGVYTITYTTTSGKGSTLQFTVSGSFTVDFVSKNPVNDILGTPVPVTIEAVLSGSPDKRAETFQLAAQANLLVYLDSALTKPVAAGADLTTDAATGTFKAYVTSRIPGTYTLDLIGGPAKNVSMDTYNNLTFIQQPKVAKPSASPPGQNFLSPIAVTLSTSTVGATILYTVDGSAPDSAEGGATRKYTGAIPLGQSMVIKAMAVMAGWINSDVLIESYAYTPPVVVKKAWYLDLNGDGQIETILIDFDKGLSAAPDNMDFKITDQTGAANERQASATKGEISLAPGSKTRLVVTLSSPFPYGVTSISNRDVSGQVSGQANIPILDQTFPVDDSVAPVPIKGEVIEPDTAHPLKRIRITLSETVDFPLGSQTALVFKRGDAEVPVTDVRIDHIEKIGDRDYQVYVDSGSNVFPIVGDSVALNVDGEIKDAAGNAPARKTFLRLDGTVPKPKPMDVYVRFPRGDGSNASANLESQPGPLFIPVGKDGSPLNGSAADGKCAGCFAGDGTNFVGPVFYMVITGPISYDFQIFNNLGEFVAAGKGIIGNDDLSRLQRNKDENYIARIVWTGRSSTGVKAATGVYILQAAMTGTRDLKSGAPPGRENRRVRFGMMR